MVTGINMYITEKYINGTFNSCSQVSVPSTGQLALDLMCGQWGASRCTPTNWYTYMGDVNNPYVPFQTNYLTFANTNPVGAYVPRDPPIIPCSQAISVSYIYCPQTSANQLQHIFLPLHSNRLRFRRALVSTAKCRVRCRRPCRPHRCPFRSAASTDTPLSC